jgi:hypothetical protein
MIRNILIFFSAAIILAGCASSKDKADRVDYSTAAKLTIPVFSSQWENGYMQIATKDKKGCGEFGKNVLPDVYDKDFSLPVEQGKDIFVHVTRAYGINSCDSVEMFYATRGNEYIFNIENVNQKCVVSLFEIAPGVAKRKINTYPAHVSKIDGVKVCQSKSQL